MTDAAHVPANRQAPTPSPDLTARMVEFVREVARRDDSLGDDACALLAELEPVNPIEAIARRLIDQHDEPWPEGTESNRLHYWRSKAIRAANDLRALERGEANHG